MIFSDFFLIFEIFFSRSEKTIKSHEIWICFQKKITHYTQEGSEKPIETIRKYDSKLLSISGVFKNYKKIGKNSYVFGQIDKLILAKRKVMLPETVYKYNL